MITNCELHRADMNDAAYREAYEAQDDDFALIEALLAARTRAKLSQAGVARRMGTTKSAASQLESGRVKPSTRT